MQVILFKHILFLSTMNFIRNLLYPMSNVEEIAFLICEDLGVKVSLNSLSKHLREHPYFPSLLAVHDGFKAIGIDTLTLKTNDIQQVKQHTALVQIKAEDGGHLFAYIYAQTDECLDWFNPIKHKREIIKHEDFSGIFTSYVMLFEASSSAGEKDYPSSHRSEIRQSIIEFALILFVPVFFALTTTIHISQTGFEFWQRHLYVLFLLVGYAICGLLLLHDYNEESSILSNFCGRNEKTNCAAVLHSKGSQFWGISWSVIGGAYFLGMLLTLLISFFDSRIFHTIAVLHGFTLPYVIYSLYYQKFKIKQWCTLCLSVQAVLVILFFLSVIFGAYHHIKEITVSSIIFVLGISFLAFTSLFFLWHLAKQVKENRYGRRMLNRFKYDKDVFNALLQKQKKITIPTEDYGIILGNPNGNIHIVEVYNPYCGHCANAQAELRKLLETNDEIKVHIIFAADPDSEYYDQMPIDMFLSLYEEKADVASALSDWFDGKVKTTEELKQKYPVTHVNTPKNRENAKAMDRFCKETEITGTPTIFINGNRLPDIYRTGDLMFFY